MKFFFKFICIIILNCCLIDSIVAQTSELEAVPIEKHEFEFPPLQVVIDSVIKRSAMVRFRKNNIRVKESALGTERVYWSKNLGVQADTRYGNLSNFSTSEDGASNTAALTTAKQFNYSFGIFVKFPLFDAINRKHQIRLAKSEIEGAKNMVEFEKEELRKTVIVLYQGLIFKRKILQIKSRSLGDGRVNMQMVEKEFRNGIVPIAEYVRIVGITENNEADYAKAMSEFITAKLLLEDMAGFVFSLKRLN